MTRKIQFKNRTKSRTLNARSTLIMTSYNPFGFSKVAYVHDLSRHLSQKLHAGLTIFVSQPAAVTVQLCGLRGRSEDFHCSSLRAPKSLHCFSMSRSCTT